MPLLITATLLFGLVAASGQGRRYWPFVHWSMYSTGNLKALRVVKWHQLRVRTVDGRWKRIWPGDLFSLDDDASGQPSGERLVNRVLSKRAVNSSAARGLTRRVSSILGTEVDRVEIWQLEWNVRFDQYPPLDRNHPDKSALIATIGPQSRGSP